MKPQYLLAVVLTLAAAWAHAGDDEPADAQATEIAGLIEQVLGDDLAERREATDKLLKIGAPAVAPLSKAAESTDETTVTRAFDALGRMLVSDNEATAKAAQESLDQLSKSDIDIVGRRARTTVRLKEILKQREALLKAAPPAGGGIQFNGKAIAGHHKTSIRIENGKRHIETESGDEKVVIDDVNGKDIKLKHTRTVDGKSKTDEYEAADLDELKKKHPEAAKLYEKHGAGKNAGNPFGFAIGGVGGVQIQIAPAVPGLPRNPGAPIPDPGFRPNPSPAGPRTIKAERDGRKIEVTETDGKNIRVKMTKLVNGKEVSQEFTAEDLATLKQEHPEAATLYEQLTGRKAD